MSRMTTDELLALYPHYYKDVRHLEVVDVYRVIELFGVTDPTAQHALKKLLVPGKRGVKDAHKDLGEAINTLERGLLMREEDARRGKDNTAAPVQTPAPAPAPEQRDTNCCVTERCLNRREHGSTLCSKCNAIRSIGSSQVPAPAPWPPAAPPPTPPTPPTPAAPIVQAPVRCELPPMIPPPPAPQIPVEDRPMPNPPVQVAKVPVAKVPLSVHNSVNTAEPSGLPRC